MPKFKKKPVIFEAKQWWRMGDHPAVKRVWKRLAKSNHVIGPTVKKYVIDTIDGEEEVTPGTWIITLQNGDFYPCEDEIFRQNYELVED